MSNKKNVLFLREEYGDGQGTYIYPNGEKYVGGFKDGKYHGQGTSTNYYAGVYLGKYEGEHRNGNMWNGRGYDKNGNIKRKWVNGKEIKQ